MPYKDPEKAKQNAKERYLKNIEARKAKMRENYRENKEERLSQSKEYVKANREKILEYQAKYRQENKEKATQYKKQYYLENKAELAKKAQNYQRENPEGVRRRNRKYRGTEKGKENWTLRRNARRKRERDASLGMVFYKEILEIYAKCRNICREKRESYEVDHIIPISHRDVCGLHVPWNMQILPAIINRKKTNKLDYILDEDLL
jgi:hypothetical protein